jgi:hypothetical protein
MKSGDRQHTSGEYLKNHEIPEPITSITQPYYHNHISIIIINHHSFDNHRHFMGSTLFPLSIILELDLLGHCPQSLLSDKASTYPQVPSDNPTVTHQIIFSL